MKYFEMLMKYYFVAALKIDYAATEIMCKKCTPCKTSDPYQTLMKKTSILAFSTQQARGVIHHLPGSARAQRQ